MRWLVVAGVMAVTLMGAMAPAHATTLTYSFTTSLDVESDHVSLAAQTAPAWSDLELESLARELAPPAASQDSSRQSRMTTATPPPSMLLLVGTGLTGLGMVRRRLARRHGIAW